MLDSNALADLIAELVGDHVDRATAPLIARIQELEGRDPSSGLIERVEDVERGLQQRIDAAVEERFASVRQPVDGKDADPEVMRQMVADAVAALPPAKDGAPGRDGKDGHDVEDIEVTQDGRTLTFSFTVDDVVSVFEIELPEAKDGEAGRDGKDADPEAIRQMVQEAVAQIPAPKDGEPGKDGKDGKLPLAKAWSEGAVHYEGEVVTHDGATWQALKDTGRAPGTEDWSCLAARGGDGRDAREFTIRGTWAAENDYQALDVVALNGASFVAKQDDPGPCPGEGWQLMAAQGKRGAQGERGAGPKGDRGDAGPPVVAAHIEANGMLTLVNGDGSTVDCDLYPVLSKVI